MGLTDRFICLLGDGQVGLTKGQVVQGALGDRWLMSALACEYTTTMICNCM